MKGMKVMTYYEWLKEIQNKEDEICFYQKTNDEELEDMIWSNNYDDRIHALEFKRQFENWTKDKKILDFTDLIALLEWFYAFHPELVKL